MNWGGMIASNFDPNTRVEVWNTKFRKNLKDWEVEDLVNLLNL